MHATTTFYFTYTVSPPKTNIKMDCEELRDTGGTIAAYSVGMQSSVQRQTQKVTGEGRDLIAAYLSG